MFYKLNHLAIKIMNNEISIMTVKVIIINYIYNKSISNNDDIYDNDSYQ